MKSSLFQPVLLSSLLIFTLLLGCGNEKEVKDIEVKENEVQDIDGNVYPTVRIGDQVWMAENLRTSRFQEGSPIENVTDDYEWSRNSSGASVSLRNNPDNDIIYGKLYNFYVVEDSRNVCPIGWHVPSVKEWEILDNFLSTDIGFKMKSTTGWSKNGYGSNSSGFNGLPSGIRDNGGEFVGVGSTAIFWTSSRDGIHAVHRSLSSTNRALTVNRYEKKDGYSVRCIKD